MEHKQLAIQLFNETWDLLDNNKRTKSEDALMIHKAHASLFHWFQVGTPLEFQRGVWLVSHVYALLKMPESAIFHALRCFEITETNNIKDFDLTFAYEALARAYALVDKAKAKKYLDLGIESLKQIKNVEDLNYCKTELEKISL